MKKLVAFSLAEILITLGIIGVISAMTLPVLIQSYQRHVVETRLKKFYSTMNQAVKMAEIDYGAMGYWLPYWSLWGAEGITRESEVATDFNGNSVKGNTLPEKFFNKYFIPYLKGAYTEPLDDGTFIVHFADGTSLRQNPSHPEKINSYFFYPSNPKRCGLYPDKNITEMNKMAGQGKCCFEFSFSTLEGRYNNERAGFEPNKYYWDSGTRKQLVSLCKTYRFSCAALIQYDGWHVSNDYPQKFKL